MIPVNAHREEKIITSVLNAQGLGWPCIIVNSIIYQQLIMTLWLQV
jgi:hypothetical protein